MGKGFVEPPGSSAVCQGVTMLYDTGEDVRDSENWAVVGFASAGL